jgi:hypothetical protein
MENTTALRTFDERISIPSDLRIVSIGLGIELLKFQLVHFFASQLLVQLHLVLQILHQIDRGGSKEQRQHLAQAILTHEVVKVQVSCLSHLLTFCLAVKER